MYGEFCRGFALYLARGDGRPFEPSRLVEEGDEPLPSRRTRKDGFLAPRVPAGRKGPHLWGRPLQRYSRHTQ